MADNRLLDHVSTAQFGRALNPLYTGVQRPTPPSKRGAGTLRPVAIAALESHQETVDPSKVRALRRVPADSLKPIEVVRYRDERYVVDDGNHRAVAAHSKRKREIMANVRWADE